MDILQQEDIVKGLPDAALQMELQMPSGRIPEFLVLSEVQRRADMRQRFAAQEPMPSSTVKQQVMAQGLASMAAPLPSVPAGPDSSLPSVPAGSAPEGPVGMGGLGMAAGGKTETKSDFPDYSGDGEITKKDILIGRGVIPMQDGGQYNKAVRSGEAIVLRRGEDPRNYTEAELFAIGIQQRYTTRGELEQPFGGVGAEEPMGTFEEYTSGLRESLSDKDRFPYFNLTDEQKEELPTEQRRALAVREGLDIVGEGVAKAPGALAREASEYIVPFITGTTDPLDVQKQQIAESTDSALSRFLYAIDPRNYPETFSRDNLALAAGQGLGLVEDYIVNPFNEYLGPQSEFGRYMRDPETVEAFGDRFGEIIEPVATFLTEEGPDGGPSILDRASDFIGLTDYREGQETPAQQKDNLRGKGTDTTQSTDQNLADGSGTDGSGREITENVPAAILLGGDQGNPLIDQAFSAIENLKTSQGDVQTNLQDLITQTQQDAKNRALYAGVMGLAQGIAAGDMAKGLERASDQAGRIMAASETAVAPLRAAQAVAPTENLKAQVDAITDLARADATYQSVAAQFRREEGLDRRSQAQLMSAATRMVDTVFEDGVFTDFKTVEEAAAARAAAAKQIYDELSLMYGDSMIPSSAGSTFTRTPDGNLRYVVQ